MEWRPSKIQMYSLPNRKRERFWRAYLNSERDANERYSREESKKTENYGSPFPPQRYYPLPRPSLWLSYSRKKYYICVVFFWLMTIFLTTFSFPQIFRHHIDHHKEKRHQGIYLPLPLPYLNASFPFTLILWSLVLLFALMLQFPKN